MKNIDLVSIIVNKIMEGDIQCVSECDLKIVYKGATISSYNEWRKNIIFEDFFKQLFIKNIKIEGNITVNEEGIFID